MKKILVMMAFVFGLMFSGVGELKAESEFGDCPDGFAESEDMIMTVGDCEYLVGICYNCPTTVPHIEVTVKGFRLLNPLCVQDPAMSAPEILLALHNQMRTVEFAEEICDPGDEYIPCDEVDYENDSYCDVAIFHAKCWYKYRDTIQGQHLVWNFPCLQPNYCVVHWRWCWDDQLGIVAYNPRPNTEDPGRLCTLNESAVPDPAIGEESDCYIMITPCD